MQPLPTAVNLSPMHLKISGLLTGRLFRIPEYQRAYAWGTRQRSDLFADILGVKETGREHFMATVVALGRERRLIGADEFTTVEVVDGQQRITTLVILLKAIEKALDLEDRTEAKIKREIQELLVKDDAHSLVLLQTNHDTSNVFPAYIRDGDLKIDQAHTAADMNVIDAATECEAFVAHWKTHSPLVELVAIIRNQLSLIYHEIPDEATVYRVFEVLNSRGLDVKWIDKLKSQLMASLFEYVEQGTRKEAVLEMQGYWRDIYRTLGRRGDLGDEALRFTGTFYMSAEPRRILGQEDAVVALVASAGRKIATIAKVGSDLRAVVQAVGKLNSNARLRAVTKVVHARFVATAIMLREFDTATEEKLLNAWERVTFRIFGLGGADARHKVGEYVRLAYRIYSKEISADDILEVLRSIGVDYEIDTLITGPEYWENCYEGWTEELRYLLYRYDEHLAEVAGQPLSVTQWNKIWLDEPSRSIEHITPQSDAQSYTHEVGNLTMLPPRINSSLQADPPASKAETYLTSGLLGTMEVGLSIRRNGVWDEKAVRERTRRIHNFALQEWK
ncbi:DUF262 domain-containing protein [Rhizobium bangladeshense]|uniref:DUF262 domain-containing protein n=1 Tax=Rhizobium bangladeshense TaxID=1138189 RepID=UPI001EB92A90|nr:DUF262 domain-containing HNH endonuclease family protein [Rhizobium bangladeshense]MBX4873274.1 DUF262 domain-containing protein [Rhizobium bangladeshense]